MKEKETSFMAEEQPPSTRLLFVSGPPRSGTTLLASLLSTPPAFPYLPECSVLTSIIHQRLQLELGEHALKFSHFLTDTNTADRLYASLISNIIQNVIYRSSLSCERSVLVLKDPYLIFIANLLTRFIEADFRIVLIIRDPRDAVASFMNVRKRGGKDVSLPEAIEFIKPFHDQMLEFATGSLVGSYPLHLIRYEQLAAKDVGVLKSLEQFIGYSLNSDQYGGAPLERLDPSSEWHTDLYAQPITPERVNAYRRLMSADEIAAIENAFAASMHAFGYRTMHAEQQENAE